MTKVRLPDGFVDELKARLRPSDVIGRKVKLKRQGKEWVGLSPFTNEKTPSFYVNDAKGIFKDFSSGLGGDVIKFVQETERLSFMEAVERLAEEAGLEIPKASAEEEARYDRLARLKAACAAASRFFQARLHASEGGEARTYLRTKRGLDDAAWARWGIGFAPDDWRKLTPHLKREGFSDDEIIGAGLARRSDKGGEPYDVFRNRIMFPITDVRGDVIAFGGRALDPDDKAKYLNSPETELFHKSRVLYNYRRARESIGYGERGGLIVCEGYMDVIALGEAEIDGAVAPLGTALTAEQLDLLWKAGPDPVVCLDGDAAGLRAAQRAVSVALPKVQPDQSVFFCLMPDGMDPDDLIRQPGGPARMRAALKGAIPLIEMLWQRERDAEPVDTPERKAGLEARLKAAAGTIGHPGVRAAYERDLMARMREHFWQLRQGRPAEPGRPSGRHTQLAPRDAEINRKVRGQRQMKGLSYVATAIDNAELLNDCAEMLAQCVFRDEDVARIRDACLDLIQRMQTVDREAVRNHLTQAGFSRAVELLDTCSNTPVLQPGTLKAREWLVALEHYAAPVESEPARPAGEATRSPAEWRLLRLRVAERRARKLRVSELADGTDQG